jgi:hypothetical protein
VCRYKFEHRSSPANFIQCEVEIPCKSCPKGLNGRIKVNSAWFRVGYKRGNLKDKMQEIKLCPTKPSGLSMKDEVSSTHITINTCCDEAHKRREKVLAKTVDNDNLDGSNICGGEQHARTVKGNTEKYEDIQCQLLVSQYLCGLENLSPLATKEAGLRDVKRSSQSQGANNHTGDPCLDQEDQECPKADMAGQSDLKQKKRVLGEELEMIKQAWQTQNVIDNTVI